MVACRKPVADAAPEYDVTLRGKLVARCNESMSSSRYLEQALRLLAIVALSLLLPGCFVSGSPKFSPDTAVAAFGDGGRYVIFLRGPDGRYSRQGPVTVNRLADGSYEIVDDKAKAVPISFHEIGSGVFAAQTKKRPNAYGYLILKRSGTETLIYIPDCEKQDWRSMSAHGVAVAREFECSIENVTEPAKLLAAVSAAEPRAKMVSE
jgi:hypothetical protein